MQTMLCGYAVGEASILVAPLSSWAVSYDLIRIVCQNSRFDAAVPGY
jgi:hypothetical protein